MLQVILAVKNSDPKTKVRQKDIAAVLGVTEGYVSQIISGDAQMSEEQADKVAALLKVDRGLIWRDAPFDAAKVIGALAEVAQPALSIVPAPDRVAMLDRKLLRHLIRSVEKSEENTEALPVYKVAASRPDEDTPREADPAFIPHDIRKPLGKGGIALRIVGESMLDAGIEPGDIVFAKRPSSRPADRSIVVALLHGATTCKRLVGNELIAESPVHEDHAPIEDDAIIGVVLAIYKPDRSTT